MLWRRRSSALLSATNYSSTGCGFSNLEVEDEESVAAIQKMADRIDALGEAIREELAR